MQISISGNESETFLSNNNQESDEISSINVNECLFPFSLFPEIHRVKYQIPLDEEDFYTTLEIAINECFKINEEKSIFQTKNSDKIFEVIRPIKVGLFTKLETDLSKEKEDTFMKRKRYSEKRSRKENQDNIRKKIKRGFLNNALIPKINMIIKKHGGKIFFEIFKQHFVSDVTRKRNMELINMTLEEIFRKKELYHETDINFYYHNLKLVNSKEIQENKELKNILNLKLIKIFQEYINSKEFNIDEINRLKSKNMKDSYIKRYIYLAQNFIQFLTE